jgi:predicted pore-forming effector associated with SMODS systems
MNTIPVDQNAAEQLDRLAAQRQLYSEAKRLEAVRTIIAVPLVLAWSVVTATFPQFQVYAAAWGIVVTLFDIAYLNRWQRSLQRRAAKIQEMFDCDVLDLPWRQLTVGHRPDVESVIEASKKYKAKDSLYVALYDWYPTGVGTIPLSLARIVCQRANCWWDAKLRRRYALNALALVGLLTLAVLLIGLVGGFSVDALVLSVLAPLLPAFTWAIRQYYEQIDYATAADKLKEYCETLWSEAVYRTISDEDLALKSRELQDGIFERRCRGPLIFDWIYRYFRRGYEEQMNIGAEALIQEAVGHV